MDMEHGVAQLILTEMNLLISEKEQEKVVQIQFYVSTQRHQMLIIQWYLQELNSMMLILQLWLI